MTYQDEQYERVARFLDGEIIELTADEHVLADEITAGEAQLSVLDAPVPEKVMDRAHRRLVAAAARPSVRRRVLGFVVSLEAAAVAAVLIVVGTLAVLTPDLREAFVPTEVFVQSTEASINCDLSELESQLDDLEANIVVFTSDTDEDELGIDSMQQEMQEFFQTVPSGGALGVSGDS